jgi:hypothetical protein
MRTAEDYKRLSTELSLDIELLDKLAGKHAKAVAKAKLSPEDDLGWAAVGYTIHNIYCLFDTAFAQRIDTLRRFRHAFRNMYQGELDPRRLGILNEDLPGILEDFRPWHEKFTAALALIAINLENPDD